MSTKPGLSEKQITQARDCAVACCDAMQSLGHTLNREWLDCQRRIRDGVDSAEAIDAFEGTIEPALLRFLRTGNALRKALTLNADLLEAVTRACHDLPLATAYGETFTTHLEATIRFECVAWLTFVGTLEGEYTGVQPALVRVIGKARGEGVDGYDEPQEIDHCAHDAWRFEYYVRLLDGVKARRWFLLPDGWYAGIDKEWSRALAAVNVKGLTVSEVADKLMLSLGWTDERRQYAMERVSRACGKGELLATGKGKATRRIDPASVAPWLLKQAEREA